MKKYILIITAALLTGLTSCVDLDLYPLEELSDASFWKTPKDAEMAVSDLYPSLPGWWSEIDDDINSDNAVHGIKWAAGNISKGIYDPLDFSWSGNYSVIRQTNLILSKIGTIPDYNQEEKEKVLGQTYFFRAFHYFNLIRSYGDVPYIDKPLTLADQNSVVRAPREEVYTKMMEDFDKAIAYLPVSWPSSDYGRITKGAALAMKARAALYYGNWQVAADNAKKVMDLGVYNLYDQNNTGKYAELFWEKVDKCDEFILVQQYESPSQTDWLLEWRTYPTRGWGGLNPTQSLVEAFEDINGAPIAQSTIYDEKNPFENRDPRLEVNVLHDGESVYAGDTIKVAPLPSSGNTGISRHGDATATGYYEQKWLDPSVTTQAGRQQTNKDYIIIRYAEVLLTYAEALNEISPLASDAFDAVNQVRRRVGMPELQNSNASLPTYCATQDDLRQRIRNEWRVEFALEGGKRQWDIRRWGIAEQVLNEPFHGLKYKLVDSPNAHKNDKGKICILYEGDQITVAGYGGYKPHNYVYPVPQKERDLNPNLTQNPGY